MATAPSNPPVEEAPAIDDTAPAAAGMRRLDKAAGGDEVPAGPLGGPVFKTNEQLNAERVAKEAAARDAELEAAGVSVTVDNTGDPAPPVNIGADPVTPPPGGETTAGGNPLS